jgi:hypothetical protein
MRLRLESGLDQDFHLPPMSLALESRVVVSDEQVHTSLGDEAVILGLGDGVYYGLDAVGARVWSLLAAPRQVSEIVAVVTEEFDVGRERCEHDVLALLGELADRRLIREESDGGHAAAS